MHHHLAVAKSFALQRPVGYPSEEGPHEQQPPRQRPVSVKGFWQVSRYGAPAGLDDASQTSLVVATSSFMFDHDRPPGTDFLPSMAAWAKAMARACTRSFSSSGQVS